MGEYANDAWLYYLNTAAGYVRQTTDASAQLASAWAYSPDGLVLVGPQGTVSHLVCDGVYDWATGLIYRNGRYFDPTLGIWLGLSPLVMIQSWRGRNKRQRRSLWYVLLLLVMCAGVTACDGGPRPRPECPNPDTRYQDYGFIFENFDEYEMQVLGVTITAYADHVGGPQQLKKVLSSKYNPVVVWKDPDNIGANTSIVYGDIRLGTTTFDREAALANRYSLFGSVTDEELAQYQFGHEIGHNLIAVLVPTKNWTAEYRDRVPKVDGAEWSSDTSPNSDYEQEAVTKLALFVLEPSWGRNALQETDPDREAKIRVWAQDFLDALKNY